jgi:transcription factor C subunit 3
VKIFFNASHSLRNDPYDIADEMASELEGLIAGLLVHISCHGEEGKFLIEATYQPLL